MLPDPLVVKVTHEDGSAAGAVSVVFNVTAGGGVVSKSSATTNDNGRASTHLTLGPTEGVNTVKANIEGMGSKAVFFDATASYAYCEDAETTLVVSYGTEGSVIIATPKSGLYDNHAGLVLVYPFLGGQVTSFLGFPPGLFTTQLWDVAFSPRGDLYVTLSELFDWVLKIAPNKSTTEFASINDYHSYFSAAEITTYSDGLIAGCNNKGPFLVTCGDSIQRFPGAIYSGEINNDAVAADPITDDIYFIHESQSNLLRLPIDTLTATGPVEVLAQLTTDEATGARGMVCDSDRMIYILVDTNNIKKILMVSAVDGAKTDLYDFFSRGSGSREDAGIQRDIALDSHYGYLYTVDTLNNALLRYQLPMGPLTVAKQDTTISMTAEGGERVGIAVLK